MLAGPLLQQYFTNYLIAQRRLSGAPIPSSAIASEGRTDLLPSRLKNMNSWPGYTAKADSSEPLLDRLRGSSEAATVDHFSVLVEGAVMAPDIAKVDADRHLDLGLPAWNFSDEVLRWFLHGNSLLLLRRTCSSHL
jgi:hypothetical protein